MLPPCVAGIGSGRAAACASGAGTIPEPCQALLPRCSARNLRAGQHLFYQGDPQTFVYYIRAGALRLYKTLENGRRQVVGFGFAGDFVGLGLQAEYPFNAQAIGRCELRCLPRAMFHGLATAQAQFAFKLYEAVSLDLTVAQELALTIGQRDSEASLAAFLLWLMRQNERRGGDARVIALPMMRTDIADYLGLTVETVSRTFTKFRRRRLIEMKKNRVVRLLDLAGLTELAEGAIREGKPSSDTRLPPALSPLMGV